MVAGTIDRMVRTERAAPLVRSLSSAASVYSFLLSLLPYERRLPSAAAENVGVEGSRVTATVIAIEEPNLTQGPSRCGVWGSLQIASENAILRPSDILRARRDTAASRLALATPR